MLPSDIRFMARKKVHSVNHYGPDCMTDLVLTTAIDKLVTCEHCLKLMKEEDAEFE